MAQQIIITCDHCNEEIAEDDNCTTNFLEVDMDDYSLVLSLTWKRKEREMPITKGDICKRCLASELIGALNDLLRHWGE
jgi:hypothetical protein